MSEKINFSIDLPCNTELEKDILAAMTLDDRACRAAIETLTGDEFFDGHTRRYFEEAKAQFSSKGIFDAGLLTNGSLLSGELIVRPVHIALVEEYCAKLRDTYKRRQIVELSYRLATQAVEGGQVDIEAKRALIEQSRQAAEMEKRKVESGLATEQLGREQLGQQIEQDKSLAPFQVQKAGKEVETMPTAPPLMPKEEYIATQAQSLRSNAQTLRMNGDYENADMYDQQAQQMESQLGIPSAPKVQQSPVRQNS